MADTLAHLTTLRRAAPICGALAALVTSASPTWAAKPPPAAPTAPVAKDLIACRKVADTAARLACYDRTTDALAAAEASGAVVVVDREQVRQIKRQAFGLNLPTLSLITPKGRDDSPSQVEFKVESARQDGEGHWVVHAEGGAVWRAYDSADLYPEPRAGDAMTVRRGAIGSFFCKAGSTPGFKCARIG